MDTRSENGALSLTYSGRRFIRFLQRNRISYKEPAEKLSIDKNTVGKAVRGGNLNIDIVLRICNVYGMRITDFFMLTDENDADYYLGFDEETTDADNLSEEEVCYKKCEKISERIAAISDIVEKSKQMLTDLTRQYDECDQLLRRIITRHDHNLSTLQPLHRKESQDEEKE